MANEKDRRRLMRALGLAVRMHQNAVELVDDAAAAHLGVNRTDMRCLDIIDRRGRLTAGELAVETGLTSGAITTALDRLEAKGYVRRIRDDVDRRRVMVEATDEARGRAWEVYGPMAAALGTVCAGYSDAELGRLQDFLERGRELLVAHAEQVRARLPRPPGDPPTATP